MIELILLRHGQSEGNLAKIFQGQMDLPLTELGREQARDAGRRLGDFVPELLLSSPLSRAYETAQLACPGCEIVTDPGFLEVGLGEMEGLTWPEAEAKFPDLMPHWMKDMADFCPPGGESGWDVFRRTGEALERYLSLAEERGYQRILLVSHYLALASIMARLTGGTAVNVPRFSIGNARMAKFHIFDGDAVLKMVEDDVRSWFA